MVEETNASLIIMICNLEEKNRIKCHQYWPKDENVDKIFKNNLTVHLEFENEIKGYEGLFEKRFILTNKDKTKIRTVTQMHFQCWPDHGVPKIDFCFNYFNYLFEKIRENEKDNKDYFPTIVHCSAGIGRTGTFITSYSLWYELTNRYQELKKCISNHNITTNKENELEQKEPNLNNLVISDLNNTNNKINSYTFSIFKTVAKIKDCRCFSVENSLQYELIYAYVFKLIKSFKNKIK